jgi:hypothetical protein
MNIEITQSLLDIAQKGERLYASANEHDLKKAIRSFRERQLAAEYDEEPTLFYKRVHNRWLSCLTKSDYKRGKLWLLDVDTPEQELEIKKWLRTTTEPVPQTYSYNTKTGKHFLISPTNKDKLHDVVFNILNENPLILLGY